VCVRVNMCAMCVRCVSVYAFVCMYVWVCASIVCEHSCLEADALQVCVRCVCVCVCVCLGVCMRVLTS